MLGIETKGGVMTKMIEQTPQSQLDAQRFTPPPKTINHR